MSDYLDDIPEGFTPLKDSAVDAPDIEILEAERWLDGSVVIYHGLKEWISARGERHRAHAIQTEGDETGHMFGIWTTAVLDRLFAQVAKGERVYVRYDGLYEHPTLKGKSMHRWTVAKAQGGQAGTRPTGSASK